MQFLSTTGGWMDVCIRDSCEEAGEFIEGLPARHTTYRIVNRVENVLSIFTNTYAT